MIFDTFVLGPLCHKRGNWDPYVNWCPPCLSFVRFVTCCHCLCIRSFVPCHWNAGLLRLVGLKEYGLDTHSLGLDWPLSEVGTPPPHNSGMSYGLETKNKQQTTTHLYSRFEKRTSFAWNFHQCSIINTIIFLRGLWDWVHY